MPRGALGKVLVAAVAAALLLSAVSSAFAVHDLGLFELDGDTTHGNAITPLVNANDWDQVFAANGSDGAMKSLFVTDQYGAGDEIDFASGADKDNNDVSAWDWTTSPTLSKDDISHAGAAIYTSGSDTIAYFFLDRISAGTGDADVGFWFFKGFHNLVPNASDPTKGTFSGSHEVGDVLVVSEFTNGGGVSTVNVFTWVGGKNGNDDTAAVPLPGAGNGPLQLKFQGVDCRVTGATDTACATVNEGAQTFSPPWAYTNTDGNSTYQLGAFFEGGVNLTALGLDIGCGGTFLADTRASQSTDARLHDFAMGELSLCSANISTTLHNASHGTIAEGGSVALGSDVHDLATVSKATGPASAPQPTGSVSFRAYDTVAACTADTGFSGGTAKGTVTLAGGPPPVAHPSTSTGALAPGTYAFKAEYLGDSNYAAKTSTCETFTVLQGSSTTTTTLHNADHTVLAEGGSVALGSVIHDLATVTVSPAFAAPTGSVSFRFYTSAASCTADTGFTGGTAKGTIALDGSNPGAAHPSTDSGALGPGTYAFKASWPGDSNYTGDVSDCETFTVLQAPSDIVTELHSSTHTVIPNGGEAAAGASLPTIHDQATVSGAVGSFAMTGNVTFRFYATAAACTADTGFTGGVTKGTIAIVSGVAHPSNDAGPLSAGTYAFKAQYSGDTNYLGSTSACEPFSVSTITLVKNAMGPEATFTYDVNGPSSSTKTITTVGTDPGTGTNGPFVVLHGAYTVDEQPLAGWTMTDISCTAGTGGADTNGDGIPDSWGFTLPAGTNVTCTFTNSAVLTTRTQGFWATHTDLANAVWSGTAGAPAGSTPVIGSVDAKLCTDAEITAIAQPGQNQLMGGFWSNVSKTSLGDKRSPLDQARMQMLQQYLAAVLNVHAFGSGSEAMLATARTVYCGTNVSDIKSQIGVLGSFNSSGDSLAFTPGASATAQRSREQADIDFWDVTFR